MGGRDTKRHRGMEKSTSSALKMKTTHVNPEHEENIMGQKNTFRVSVYLSSTSGMLS